MNKILILTALLATQLVGFAQSAATEDVVDISRGRPWLPALAPLTAEQQNTLDAFNKAFRVPDVKPSGKGVKPEELAALRKKVREEYGIHWEGTVLQGQPIAFFGKQAKLPSSPYLRDVVATINGVVAAYGKASPAQENELKEMFLDLCRHILRAGLVEGAPPSKFSGSVLPIPSANYAWLNQTRGIVSMRPVLAEEGLLLPMMRAVSWWANPDWLDETPKPNNSDLWRCGHWLDLDRSIAAMPDSPEKWQRLMAMVRFFSNNIVVGDALPPSGEFAHHWGFHLAYSYAMPFVLRDALSLHQAGLELSSAARERLRAYGRTVTWMLMNDAYYTMNLSLRPGGLGRKAMAGELRLLADLGEPDQSGPIDREMAALYLACAKPAAKDEAAARYRVAGIAPTLLTGALALPTRPGLVWRRPETLVAVAGMRPHFRGFEVYGWNQCRYPINGSVMVLKAGGEQPMPGFELERGWDWSLWPGATSVIESDAMLQPRRGLGYGGNRNPVGGVCVLANSDSSACDYLRQGADAAGLFMVDFDAGQRVTFRKSVFVVGGHVLVQTSGINSTRKEPAVTTLYQNHLDQTNQVSMLDGQALTGVATDLNIHLDQPHALTDAVGMNYRVLPVPGRTVQPALRVLRRHQTWRMCNDRYVKPECKEKAQQYKASFPPKLSSDEFLNLYQTLEGDFAVAYFDHGSAPKDAADAYVLTPDPAKDSRSELPIILTQTKAGHAAFDEATRTYAYASFEPGVTWESGPLRRTGRPAAVLLREMPDQSLKLSIASWDLKNTASFSLTLKGAWQVLAAQTNRIAATMADHDTILDIPYTGDMPQTLTFKREAP